VNQSPYQRIVYPERAEFLAEETIFEGYRIFLDHWGEITNFLRESYEILRTRRFAKTILIFGEQGCGKSVLASKISGDFDLAKSLVKSGKFEYDDGNIWHRISSGPSDETRESNISSSANGTVILKVEDKKGWIKEAETLASGNKDRVCLIIADNCERDYFTQELLGISDESYLQLGRSPAAIKAAAQRFVQLCRTSLRGCLFVFFTNDEDFAISFDDHVNRQHKGLVDIRELRMPSDAQKEAIVRINVNRLNSFSYWLCIDRAGPEEKKAVWQTLKSAETFPATFAAVDNAVRSSDQNRVGRPARKCVLNAFVLVGANDVSASSFLEPASGDPDDLFVGVNFRIRIYRNTLHELFAPARSLNMLSSEWCLRLVLAGESFVSCLLAGSDHAKSIIEQATIYHGPGVHQKTKTAHATRLAALDQHLSKDFPAPDNTEFWAKGSGRSHDYESKLKALFPTYDTKAGGFINARPDLVLGDYRACTLLDAASAELPAINSAISRDANAVEFTAIRDFSVLKLVKYLQDNKIPNYVDATQEQ
jgi:hypothetical protein